MCSKKGGIDRNKPFVCRETVISSLVQLGKNENVAILRFCSLYVTRKQTCLLPTSPIIKGSELMMTCETSSIYFAGIIFETSHRPETLKKQDMLLLAVLHDTNIGNLDLCAQ